MTKIHAKKMTDEKLKVAEDALNGGWSFATRMAVLEHIEWLKAESEFRYSIVDTWDVSHLPEMPFQGFLPGRLQPPVNESAQCAINVIDPDTLKNEIVAMDPENDLWEEVAHEIVDDVLRKALHESQRER